MNKKRNPQKRGGFVPIGDVADGLSLPGGRALTHRAATPQARHHFTRLDQIDQLVAVAASAVGAIPYIGEMVTRVIANLVLFLGGAVLVVAVKSLFAVARD